MKCKLFLLIIFLSTSIFICTRQDVAVNPVWNNQSSSIHNAQAATDKFDSNWYASVQVQSYCQSAYSNQYQQQYQSLTQNQYLKALFKSSGVKTTQDCQQIFHTTPEQLQALFSLEPVKFKHDLLQDESLPNDLIWKIFDAYQDSCWWWHRENLAEYRQDIQRVLQERDKLKEFYRHRQETQQKNILEQNQKIYHQNILKTESDFVSSYHKQRQDALTQTINQGEKLHVKTHQIDAQTQALMQMHSVNHVQFQNLSGTIFSHQLFQECANHYKKLAKIVFEHGLKNTIFATHIIDFTQTAFNSTKQEQFALAIRLSDLADILAETSFSICKGVIDSGCNMIETLQNPKPLVSALINVTRFFGGALAAYDHEGPIGITHLKAAQHAFQDDLVTFNQMCEISKQHFYEWYQTSNNQDKIQSGSQILADFTITPFILGKALKCCSHLLKQAKNSLNVARSIELAEELGLGFHEAEELLLASVQDTAKLPSTATEIESALKHFMESEKLLVELQSETSLIIEEIIESEKILKKFKYLSDNIPASSINAQDSLNRKLRTLENIMDEIVKINELNDGRIRYYTKEALAKTIGPTRGSSFVIEYNQNSGQLRTWQECYDHAGNVNRVHPKMTNGLNLNSQHYPPTKNELISWQRLKK